MDEPTIKRTIQQKRRLGIPLRVGTIVRIKPEATRFVGGNLIPDWVRNDKLYISRVNPNGTLMLSRYDSAYEVDSLFPRDVEAIGTGRTFEDKTKECPDVSIRIFGVPERIENIRDNQRRLGLPDDHIFIDENHEGCVPTARRAWTYPTDKEFVLVLQDDVELCDNFMHYVNVIVNTQPDSMISLYSTEFSRRRSVNKVPTQSPYIATNILTAQGIIMRTEWIQPCVDSWRDNIRGDDANIVLWARANNIQILATIPQIIQHLGDVSVFDKSRSMGRSEFYSKYPTEANWSNSFVTQACNVRRS